MRLFTSKESEPKDENGEKKIESIKDNGDIEAVPAAQVADEIDPVVEKRVRRKLDTHIVPLLSALYLLAFLDRSNIGNARIAGMEDDLGLSSPQYQWLLTIFYISYIVFGFLAIILANTFAGALAYGITSGNPGMAKWRVLFLVEGLPTVVMSAVAFFFLPDSPEKAKFLTEEEKAVARARGVAQAGAATRIGSIDWKEILEGLMDVKGWILGLMYFSGNVAFSSLPVFLPTILKEMGFSSVNAQGLTAPPFFLSFITVIVTCYIADRTQQRGITIAILTAIGGIGYVILATTKSVAARYFGVFLAAAGIFPAIGNILPWVTNNQGSDTRRGFGIVILNLVGQCGPLLGTRLYPTSEGPLYVKGQSICAGFMFLFCLLSLLLRTILVWENKKLDRKYGTLQEAAARGEGKRRVGVENYGPSFRYVL
ncbi:unnamed protein product [Alternaria alternata]